MPVSRSFSEKFVPTTSKVLLYVMSLAMHTDLGEKNSLPNSKEKGNKRTSSSSTVWEFQEKTLTVGWLHGTVNVWSIVNIIYACSSNFPFDDGSRKHYGRNNTLDISVTPCLYVVVLLTRSCFSWKKLLTLDSSSPPTFRIQTNG